MTSPDYDPAFAVRMRTANAAVGDRPEMALTLANSDLDEADINMVGGFTRTLENQQLVALSRLSGARTELSREDRAQLDAMGVDYGDVNDAPDNDERNWLERVFDTGATWLANTGTFLADLPGVGEVLDGLNWLNQAAKLPARLISSGIDQDNDDEIDSAMRAQGYTPGNVWDYIQFMTNQGDSLYHDLDGIREVHGDKLVDLAIEQQYDPEKFASRLADRDEETQSLVMSDEFAQVADQVDRQHISPGRDIARLVLPKGVEDSAWFTGISGTIDGAYTLLLDPTLMIGKATAGARALDHAGNVIRTVDEAGNVVRSARGPSRTDRFTGVTALTRAIDTTTGGRFRMGLRDATDQDGIRGLLAVDADGVPVTRVGRGVQTFLDRVKAFDEAADDAERAPIFARLRAEHRDLMPLFDEVRGNRVILPTPARNAADEVDERVDELALLADEPGVRPAVFGGLDDAQRGWVDAGLSIAGKKKLADSVAARRSFLAIARSRLGRELDIDEKILTDASRGSRQRFDTAVRDAVARSNPSGRTDDVPLITDAAPSFEGKLVDVNGIGHMTTKAEPIRELEDFADYFASTAGMLRLAHGVAAKRELLLPGRVALRQRVAGWNAERRQGRAAARNDEVYDHTRPYKLLPHEAEENAQRAMDDLERLRAAGQIDEAEFARRGDKIYEEIRGQAGFIARQRAKWEQRARRVSSLLPTVQAIDLTSAGSIEQVTRFARLYMNKTEADRLAAIYAAGDLGRRRQVVQGIVEQTLHASGLSRSEAGLKHIEKFRVDQADEAKRAYGLSRTDVISTGAGDRHVALLPSQLSERVLIPDFRSLQFLSTKLAVGGLLTKAGHLRALSTSEAIDTVSGAIKLGWITTAAGGFRNALDEIANAVLRAEGASLLRGRSAFSQAKANARASNGEIRRATSLQARILTSIPRALRGLPRTVNDVLVARGLGKLMSYTRHDVDDLAVKHAGELVEDYRAEVLDKTVTGSYYINDAIDPNAEALGIHQAGMMARQVRHNGDNVKYEFQGYKQVEVDGGVGLDNFVNNLGLAFQDLTSPAHVALRGITEGRDALTEVVEYMQTPVMRHFLRNAEIFKVTRAGKPVQTAGQQLEAIENYAERLIAHVTMLVSGKGWQVSSADEAAGAAARWEFDITQPDWWRNVNDDPNWVPPKPGPINPELVAMLQRGDIPDRVWLKENMADEEMPSHVIAKVFAPINPKHKVGQLAQGYTSMLAVGYEYLVTRQIRAMSRNPMLTAAYDQARRNLAGYEKHLIDNGFTEEIAESIARRSARVQAEQLVIKSIDDPTLSTQYAMLARNIHAFARAQEDWLRRWGRTIRDNPQLVQRAQLYLYGAESAGIVERDDQGNMIFTYPGSGMIVNLMGRLSGLLPGIDNPVKLPVVPDMTSRLIFLNPSLDNPVGFSAMPLVSIPWDFIASSTGSDHALLKSSMDRVLNGELGAGREWYEKLLPGWANRIVSGVLSDEDPASQYASAWTSAVVNLEAAGRMPAADASASEIARFQDELKTQISNQMVMRSIFGFFAPAAPSVPINDTTDVETGESILQPDYVWEKTGLSTLKDEARTIFGSMPYEEALVWWAENHPGELVYQVGTTPRTTVGDSEAQAPATIAAAKWMQENPELLAKYGGRGGIATYFMPQGEGAEGDFSMDAYRAQLESGIRDYKTLDQFFEDIVVQRGEALYFDTKDDADALIAEATAAGNLLEVRRLEEQWSAIKERILGTNPLLAQKFAEYATSGVARERTVAQLNALLADPQAVRAIGPQAGGVAELLFAQRQYEAARQAVYGERGYLATSKREAAKADFEAAIASVLSRFPGLGDLARGAFRVPN